MTNRIYVGNLPYQATEDDLAALFRRIGPVAEVLVPRDATTGRARGFGFVRMSDDDDARRAIGALDAHQLAARRLVVRVAREWDAGG
ncbi:MAG: RNA-binding protein [Acidobacteria bacterium]|nr:RNA-binding protein [Acidobacteriota bacterium]MDP7470941.1 RNA-binding protein [Vicinamibacterales bacterium]